MVPAASSVTGPQCSTWAPSGPVMPQVPPAPLWDWTVQCTEPVPAGRESLIWAPVASPGPAFPRVMVKPIAVPGLTDGASAVLVRVSAGQLTVSEAIAVGEPSFVVVTVAVLL